MGGALLFRTTPTEKELRVVLLGKTGAGKSSLGNTLLGRDGFEVKDGFSSGTDKCQWADTDMNGRILQVTDTPGVSDTHRDEEDILLEIGKSVAVASPGPHVILMVLRCDKRFTSEESLAYETLKSMFGPGICNHMIIVFTGADVYGTTLEEQQRHLTAEVEKCPPELKKVLDDASMRYTIVNNKAPKEDKDRYAEGLMKMIEDLVKKNRGKCFSNKMCDDVNTLVQPILKANMKGKASRTEAKRLTNEEIVQEKVQSDFYKKLKAVIKVGLQFALKVAIAAVAAAVATATISLCSVM